MKMIRMLLLTAWLPVAYAQDAGESERAGEALYYDFGCYGCHGYNATMRVPLVGDASGIMSNEELFLNYLRLRADQNPINPRNTMPNYSADTLSDEQARDIYAYILAIEDDPPEVADNAIMQELLDATRNRGPDDEN